MNLSKTIDHTILSANCSPKQVEQLCDEAMQYGFAAVCVPPYFVQQAATALNDSMVAVATVIGFPMGYACTPSKVEEIKRAIDEGADELDIVLNVCAIKSKNWHYLKNDIDSTTRAAHLKGKRSKIILETDLLSEEELEKVCAICIEVGVDFVKTSTGFNGGASVEIVQKLRSLLPVSIKIKASGGIRTKKDAEQLIEAGANRLGTSTGVKIISE